MASTVWRGYISFGLISIPVRLYRAARPERISLRRLYRQGSPQAGDAPARDDEPAPSPTLAGPARAGLSTASAAHFNTAAAGSTKRVPTANQQPAQPDTLLAPVRQVAVRKETGEVLAPQSVVKGYEYEKNRFVALESEELKSAAPATSAAMDIEEFVPLAEIDPVYFEMSYYVTPEEAGEKAYALLYRSLQLSGLVAIAQFAMHGREHAVVLRPGKSGLLAHTMYFASEVRADEEFRASVNDLSKKELELAQTLIHSLAANFEPEKYHDTYREKIQALIDKKVKGEPVLSAPAIPRQAEVIDIADALRKSLANLKKPAASAAQPASSADKESGTARTQPRRKAARES